MAAWRWRPSGATWNSARAPNSTCSSTQNKYYVAQLQYSQTRYDYLTALLTLKQQAGRLSEADLAAIDALLVEHSPVTPQLTHNRHVQIQRL